MSRAYWEAKKWEDLFPLDWEDKGKPFDDLPIVTGLVGSLGYQCLLSIYLVLLCAESLWLGWALEAGLMVVWHNQWGLGFPIA